MLKVNYHEYTVLRKQRVLHAWLAEFDKKQREREAGAIINFDKAFQVVQAWKKFTHDEKLIRQFRGRHRDIVRKQIAIASLKKNFVI